MIFKFKRSVGELSCFLRFASALHKRRVLNESCCLLSNVSLFMLLISVLFILGVYVEAVLSSFVVN